MADVNRLREMATDHAQYRTHYDGCVHSHLECAALEAIDEQELEIERLRTVLDAVNDLHQPTSVDDPRCLACDHDWPCPTHLIVCDGCKEARRG